MHRAEPKFPDKSFSSHELLKNRRERNNGGRDCFGSDLVPYSKPKKIFNKD